MEFSIERLYDLYLEHPIISTDTRKLISGSLFFALKGKHFDANAFANSALEKGCVLAIVDDPKVATDKRFILVDEVTRCLQNLAAHHRKKLNIPVIGITGTNGKTTTKELMNAVLSTQFKTHATQGNLNNHIGVPLTILSAPKNTEILLVEMGANHPNEIADLCEIAQPNFGLITNLGIAHLEGFGTFENIVKTKIALYQAVKNNNGLVFVHRQNAELMQHSESQKRLTYGDENADFTGVLMHENAFVNLRYRTRKIHTQLIGEYNFSNILAACAVSEFFKVSLENILAALERYTPSNNRSQLFETTKNTLILDAYNANPTSMSAALQSFAKMNDEQKFWILGDMLELGTNSLSEHQRIVQLLQNLNLTKGILVGTIFQSLAKDSFLSFENAEKAHQYLLSQHLEKNLILIKGSRGIQLETLIDVL